MPARVLLLLPVTSYKAEDFLAAAARLGVEVVVGAERAQALASASPGSSLVVDPRRTDSALETIRALHARAPLDAVVGTDDETVLLAAQAAAAVGLRHNPPDAVRATRDKLVARRRMAQARLRTPGFCPVDLDTRPEEVAAGLRYPVVVKPRGLSASRGVLRADDPAQLAGAIARIRRIVESADAGATDAARGGLLVEEYVPGDEVAVEGMLARGRLEVLALFDKPDPLEGPTFEETIYVTPSRKPAALQLDIERETAAACAALGLREGPLHAELRVSHGVPWVLELAARTIGGLCARTLRFGTGLSLEELVLRHALGRPEPAPPRKARAAGVMMIPVPAAGVLREVHGLDRARSVPGVEEVTLTVHRGAELVPLPEGHRYPGFIFARGDHPAEVERALRDAHALLQFEIEPGPR